MEILDQGSEWKGQYSQAIPIPEGTTMVLAFCPVFNKAWGVKENEWFLDHCRQKMGGAGTVAFRFNARGFDDAPDVKAMYHRIGRFPLESEPAFCIVDL